MARALVTSALPWTPRHSRRTRSRPSRRPRRSTTSSTCVSSSSGRKSELKLALREVRDRETGMALNALRERLETAIDAREAELERAELDRRLTEERDRRHHARHARPAGHLHLITQIRRELEDIFLGLGYAVVDGREVETDPLQLRRPQLPARRIRRGRRCRPSSSTTRRVLRTETSPAQIRTHGGSRIHPSTSSRLGRVYRRDTPDATHTPTFHQVEGLAVDEGITLGDLDGTLDYLVKALFGETRQSRFITHHFPFTEPSDRAARLVPHLRRLRLPGLPALRLDRGRRRRDGRPEPVRVRRLRPRAIHGLRVRLGARANRRPPPRDPGPPRRSGATTRGFWSSSDARPALMAS